MGHIKYSENDNNFQPCLVILLFTGLSYFSDVWIIFLSALSGVCRCEDLRIIELGRFTLGGNIRSHLGII